MSQGIQRNGAPPAAKRDTLSLLESCETQLSALLPAGCDKERAMVVAKAAYQADNKLHGCDPRSVLVAVGQAFSMGLEVGKPRNHCYLVPFSGACTLILDYRGYLELMRRSGHFSEIETRLVYEADTFRIRYTPRLDFVHEPCLGDDRGNVTHVYSYAAFKDGGVSFEVMTTAEVEKVRKASRNGGGDVWRNHWEEMARKTVLRRHAKRLPQTVELAAAIAHDNETDGLLVTAQQSPQPPRQSVESRIVGRLTHQPPETHHEAATGDDEPGADDDPDQFGLEGKG